MLVKLSSLIIVVSLLGLLIAPSFAQDDWNVYTSEDETLSFTYPSDWYVFTQDFNDQISIVNRLDLVNRSVSNVTFDLETGQLGIAIGSYDGMNAGNTTIKGLPNSIDFSLGLMATGLVWAVQIDSQIYGDNEPVAIYFDEYEFFEINGHPAGQIKAVFGNQAVWFIVIEYRGL